MSLSLHIVNAFTDPATSLQGGNPAGIILNADGLDKIQKQDIAARAGLSETAFISHSDIAQFKIEFFTPNKQIAQCGHATIAAFSLLREFGLVNRGITPAETIDGLRNIYIGQDKVFLEQSPPEFVEIAPHCKLYNDILQSLGLDKNDVDAAQSPYIVNTGNKFLIIPLPSANHVQSLRPNMAAIEKISATFGLIGYYAFSTETEHEGRVAGARMFAPAYGITEESATGMAAGCLTAYLHTIRGLQQSRYMIEQGYLMPTPAPSVIDARIKKIDGPLQIIVGGQSKFSHSIELNI